MQQTFLSRFFMAMWALAPAFLAADDTIDLSGQWQFAIDRSEQGTHPKTYKDKIALPGSMLTRGKGDAVTVETRWVSSLYDSSYFFNPKMQPYREPGHMKFPFFLTPERHYVGHAWYRKTVRVPKEWKGERVVLFLERPHIETYLYVNGKAAGTGRSLSVPHQFDVTDFLKYGADNQIELRIYNGIENVCVGQDSHSVTDQTQGDWNGVVGEITLRKAPMITRQRVVTDTATGTATIYVNDTVYHVKVTDHPVLWDEFTPHLYPVTVDYHGHRLTYQVGFRDIRIQGRDILLNGQVMKVRGTVGNCCFPETGYPPCDVESWRAVFSKCKEYGLNTMRFHSYCPPDAAFQAADELGFYLQPEGPSWPNHGVKLGQGMPIDTYLLDECKAIVDQYGHHPSLLMLAAGNEPAGRWVPWCNSFVGEMHRYDPSRIYADASVGGGWAWADSAEFHIKGGARGLDWKKGGPQTTDDFSAGMDLPRNFKPTAEHPVNTAPILSHETGQWCAFPDLTETDQYTGAYKARNFEIFADLLRDGGMASQAEAFLQASGRLQVLAYKYDIERNLRTPDYAGFLLLGLNDYSGQGTALVGPLNVHWREKGYCTAADWTAFCSEVVPLARFPRFVFTTADTLTVGTQLYNATYGRQQFSHLAYTLTTDNGRAVATGSVAVGGHITLPVASFAHACPARFTLSLAAGHYRNQWDFWVYPQTLPDEASLLDGILVADTLDEHVLATLRSGGRVLLTAGRHITYGNDVVHEYLPVFWNTSWFKMRPPHTTGSLIDYTHPAFRDFPTDNWQTLQWYELMQRVPVMNLANFPKDYQPIVQPIDTWHVSRKLGLLVEANVEGGRLLLTTFDLSTNLDKRLVARQLRYSLLRYMQSSDFRPDLDLPLSTLQALFTETAPRVDMFTTGSPDELKPKIVR